MSSGPGSKLFQCVTCTDFGDSFLPQVSPEDPTSNHFPFVGLLNPRSGNKAGDAILKEARYNPTYFSRFFDIVKVATEDDVAEAFSLQLDVAKEEAKKKSEHQGVPVRPRLLCGGGDGTASFAIWCIFRALLRGGKNGALRWSDQELEEFFPAFVQLPLGTGNDFAGVLGWGRTFDPSHDRAGTHAWFLSALTHQSTVLPFDVWGLFPQYSGGVKVCSLKAMDENFDRPKFEVAGSSIPFLTLLYFSIGYDAFVAAQVECKRTESQLGNKLEYSKAIVGTMMGSKRVNVDLTGVKVTVPNPKDENQPRQYLPPTHRVSTGEEFCSAGFMNINSYSGGIFAANDPARFSDGKLDLFRQKSLAKNTLKRGLRWVTEKHTEARFFVPPSLPGTFFQYDGEARFFFNPDGDGVDVRARRVMRIPVVIGHLLEYRRGLDMHLDGEPAFQIVGSKEERAAFWTRLRAWVTGELGGEINATQAEVDRLQDRSARFLQGVCSRSQRLWADFGTIGGSLMLSQKCAKCGTSVANKGCKGCRRRFCHGCWQEHLGDAPHIFWMYEDAYLPRVASMNPLRWSSELCVDDAISELEADKSGRSVKVRVYRQGKEDDNQPDIFETSTDAVSWLRDFREQDEEEAGKGSAHSSDAEEDGSSRSGGSTSEGQRRSGSDRS